MENELNNTNEQTKTFEIHSENVIKEIRKMKKHKGAGVDNIATDILKIAGCDIVTYLEILFKLSLDTCCLPQEWKNAIVVRNIKEG